jgi:hypothetical protein
MKPCRLNRPGSRLATLRDSVSNVDLADVARIAVGVESAGDGGAGLSDTELARLGERCFRVAGTVLKRPSFYFGMRS